MNTGYEKDQPASLKPLDLSACVSVRCSTRTSCSVDTMRTRQSTDRAARASVEVPLRTGFLGA